MKKIAPCFFLSLSLFILIEIQYSKFDFMNPNELR